MHSFIPAHIAHHVVDMQQAHRARHVSSSTARSRGGKVRGNGPVHKGVNRIAICSGCSPAPRPVFVLDNIRWATLPRRAGGLHPARRASSTQSAIARTPSPCLWICSAMAVAGASGVVSTKRILPCSNTYNGTVPLAGLRARVGHKACRTPTGRNTPLAGVANVKLHVIRTFQREENLCRLRTIGDQFRISLRPWGCLRRYWGKSWRRIPVLPGDRASQRGRISRLFAKHRPAYDALKMELSEVKST